MNTSLKRLVLGTVALLSVAAIAGFTVNDIADEVEAARQRTIASHTRLVALAAPIVLGAMVVDDLATAEQTMRAMNADGAFDRVRLLDEVEARLVDASPDAPRQAEAPPWFRRWLALQLPTIRVPIEGGGVRYGTVTAAPATAALEDEAWTRVRITALETLALVAVLLLVLERVLEHSLRPIRLLAEAAMRFGSGDYSARIATTGTIEVSGTARAFNAMADSLERALGEISAKEAANRRLITAVEQTDEAIMTVAPDGVIVTWNGGAEKLFGRAAAATVGQQLEVLFAELPAPERKAQAAALTAATPALPYETRVRHAGGGVLQIAASATALVDDAGRPVGWVVFARDVTAQRQAERRLERARRQAELANRSKTEFLANMSHELRTPLNAVIGFSAVMKDELFGPIGLARYREYAQGIHDSGQHLLDLINDLLDVSAIEAEKLELHEASVDLRKTAEAAIRLVQPRAASGKVTLDWSVETGLGGVRADPRRLKQMLLNLLTNGVKFTPEGGRVQLQIARTPAGDLELAVTDSGIGMDAAGIQKALERFGQVDGSLARQHEGTGLGLPLTKGLAELHGGRLRLDSTLGHGTCAVITLPASRVEAPASRQVA